jgi:hypothetical protein
LCSLFDALIEVIDDGKEVDVLVLVFDLVKVGGAKRFVD